MYHLHVMLGFHILVIHQLFVGMISICILTNVAGFGNFSVSILYACYIFKTHQGNIGKHYHCIADCVPVFQLCYLLPYTAFLHTLLLMAAIHYKAQLLTLVDNLLQVQ